MTTPTDERLQVYCAALTGLLASGKYMSEGAIEIALGVVECTMNSEDNLGPVYKLRRPKKEKPSA